MEEKNNKYIEAKPYIEKEPSKTRGLGAIIIVVGIFFFIVGIFNIDNPRIFLPFYVIGLIIFIIGVIIDFRKTNPRTKVWIGIFK